MHVITVQRLREFWKSHSDAREPLKVWFRLMRGNRFATPHEVKQVFGQTDFLGDGMAVFNVGGNKYRIVARILYPVGRVLIRGVFTHSEYDEWSKSRDRR
jgi:mRNA interferase HigB